eukprot:1188636-Prorocentrum_minimum.AAC.1
MRPLTASSYAADTTCTEFLGVDEDLRSAKNEWQITSSRNLGYFRIDPPPTQVTIVSPLTLREGKSGEKIPSPPGAKVARTALRVSRRPQTLYR